MLSWMARSSAMALKRKAAFLCLLVLSPACSGDICREDREITVTEGDPLSLTCEVANSNTVDVYWRPDGKRDTFLGFCHSFNRPWSCSPHGFCKLDEQGQWGIKLTFRQDLLSTPGGTMTCVKEWWDGQSYTGRVHRSCRIRVIPRESTTIEPTTAESTATEPTTIEPTTTESTTTQSTTTEPTTTEPTTTESVTTESTTTESITTESTTTESTTTESTTTESTTTQPTTTQPTTTQPTTTQPTTTPVTITGTPPTTPPLTTSAVTVAARNGADDINDNDNSTPTALIVGVTVGTLLVIIVIIAVVIFVFKRRRDSPDASGPKPQPPDSDEDYLEPVPWRVERSEPCSSTEEDYTYSEINPSTMIDAARMPVPGANRQREPCSSKEQDHAYSEVNPATMIDAARVPVPGGNRQQELYESLRMAEVGERSVYSSIGKHGNQAPLARVTAPSNKCLIQ